ncbi:MAG: helix-turn-helix transcriptional regulator [Oscillospiraceae bacterium]|nr:helix-turn-helix transcriptional regulator [Oscillospiraceae bacterium]
MARVVPPSRLGAVVAAKRKLMGLSQRQLAEKTGINNATISKLEKDPTLVPDTRTLQLLAQALGLDYNYLLTLNDVLDDDRDLRIIARAKNRLSPEDQTRMMEMLRTAFDTAFADAESDGIDEADLF